jgi:hypothetical protein
VRLRRLAQGIASFTRHPGLHSAAGSTPLQEARCPAADVGLFFLCSRAPRCDNRRYQHCPDCEWIPRHSGIDERRLCRLPKRHHGNRFGELFRRLYRGSSSARIASYARRSYPSFRCVGGRGRRVHCDVAGLHVPPGLDPFRFITGIGCAGLFIIAESWLNGSSDASNRARSSLSICYQPTRRSAAVNSCSTCPSPEPFNYFVWRRHCFASRWYRSA